MISCLCQHLLSAVPDDQTSLCVFFCSLVFQKCCNHPPSNTLVLEEEVTRHSNKLGEFPKHTHVILFCVILHQCAQVLAYLPAHLLTQELPACEETANWEDGQELNTESTNNSLITALNSNTKYIGWKIRPGNLMEIPFTF